jgi:2-hydroxy-6-oxonona-2,4-dienedioate hydrolase
VSRPRVLLVWLLIALAETVHGVLREVFLAPALGDATARQFGVWIGCGIIFAISVASIRWIGAATTLAQLAVGAAWVVLMLVFEIGLGLALGADAERIVADYDPAAGGLMGFGMLFLLVAPLLADRARRVGGRAAAVRRAVILTAAFTVISALLLVWLLFQRDLAAAHARITGVSEVVETACGLIEYASLGEGPALLVVHGAGGGFDQALDALAPLTRSGLRVISMSRFGYLRTPLPADASAEAQADAHACLLNALDIPHAAILGASAGAPSATLFALRYPERTTALVLLVPALYAPRDPDEPAVSVPAGTAFLFATALRFDFLFWAAPRLARDSVLRAILATPPAVAAAASEAERARVDAMLERILPVRPRRLGLLNDSAVLAAVPRYDLEHIEMPALLISVRDDLFGTYEIARYTAAQLPNARLVGYDHGGHLWVGHHDDVMSEIAAFVQEHTRGQAPEPTP